MFKCLKQIAVSGFSVNFDWEKPKSYTLKLKNIAITFTGNLKLATSLPDDQEVPFVLPTTGSDVKGNSIPLKGTFAVTVSDTTLLSVVQPDPLTPADPLSGVIRPVGPLGNAQVTFTDTGDTASPLTVVVEFSILAGSLVTINPPVLGSLRPINSAPTAPATTS